MLRRAPLFLAGLLLAGGVPVTLSVMAQNDRDAAVRKDLEELGDSKLWTYNDVAAGTAKAKESGKPLLVVLR